ncbi:hypothetical protein V5O48_006065 [Marasmius crinis-equi]|uniref:Deoxyribose-phosphate aldolase n=1 Tax=Marasmius crinis-equi TaxID=585013 RepID=A0ABR3FKJ4_9AGAR
MDLLSQKVSEALADTSELANSFSNALVDEAVKYRFRSCCVNSIYVNRVAEKLKGASFETIACAVIGFPLGASTTAAKAFEIRDAITSGAQEIDMVMPIGLLKTQDYAAVHTNISFIVQAAAPVPVKVIVY